MTVCVPTTRARHIDVHEEPKSEVGATRRIPRKCDFPRRFRDIPGPVSDLTDHPARGPSSFARPSHTKWAGRGPPEIPSPPGPHGQTRLPVVPRRAEDV